MFIQFLVALSDMQDQRYHPILDEANCNPTLFVWIWTSNIIYLLGIEYILKGVSVLFSLWGGAFGSEGCTCVHRGQGCTQDFLKGTGPPLGCDPDRACSRSLKIPILHPCQGSPKVKVSNVLREVPWLEHAKALWGGDSSKEIWLGAETLRD